MKGQQAIVGILDLRSALTLANLRCTFDIEGDSKCPSDDAIGQPCKQLPCHFLALAVAAGLSETTPCLRSYTNYTARYIAE